MIGYYELLEKCKRGQPKAQRLLYDIFKAKLMGICRRYTRTREEAQDVMQESFVKIFNNIGQLESPEKLESWTKTTTIRTAINHYHREKKFEALFSPLPDVKAPESSEKYADVQEFSDEHLIALINDLPDGCRVVFNMFALEGYSHQEISEMLKISEGTSRSQFHYARSLLKAKLKCQDLTHYYEKFA